MIKLWHYSKSAILPEVVIKGECSGYFQPFHEGKTGAIGKGEIFIMVLVKDLPAIFPVKMDNRLYGKKCDCLECVTKFNGRFISYDFGKEIKCFYNYEIRCNKFIFLNDQIGIALTGYLCKLVIFVDNSNPCAGIQKDIHFEVLIKRFWP